VKELMYLLMWRTSNQGEHHLPLFLSASKDEAVAKGDLIAAVFGAKRVNSEPEHQWARPDVKAGGSVQGFLVCLTPEDTKELIQVMETRVWLENHTTDGPR